jgi:hypothetical protein
MQGADVMRRSAMAARIPIVTIVRHPSRDPTARRAGLARAGLCRAKGHHYIISKSLRNFDNVMARVNTSSVSLN